MSTTVKMSFGPYRDGGYMNASNPQAYLHIPATGDVKLNLKRDDEKCNNGVMFAVFPGAARLKTVNEAQSVAKSQYVSFFSVTLDTHLAAGDYVVLCFQQTAGASTGFTLSSTVGTLTALEFAGGRAAATVQAVGEGAAGYGSHKNPQFFITLAHTTDLTLTLKNDTHKASDALRFFVQKAATPGSRVMDWGTDASRLYTSAYLTAPQVGGTLAALAPGTYAVLCFKQAATPATFTLSVEAEQDPDVKIASSVFEVPKFTVRTVDEAVLAPGRRVAHLDATKADVAFYEWKDAKRLVDTITKSFGPDECFRDTSFDPTNPATLNSCPRARPDEALEPCEWRRFAEIAPEPVIFSGGASAEDIKQGFVGNCWLCAIIAALGGNDPELVEGLIYPSSYNPAGVYSVRLFLEGQWMGVLLDDFLPTRGGVPAFAHSGCANEFWFSLLEKAVAKVSGSYLSLIGHLSVAGIPFVLTMFTGGSANWVSITAETTEEWWAKMVQYTERHWLVTTSTRQADDAAQVGLVAEHAYTVLRTVTVDTMKLVKCRNTWGKFEWTGAWCDSSELWQRHPQVARACGVDPAHQVASDDGEFWISLEDFTKRFSVLNLCEYSKEEIGNTVVFDGEWTSADWSLGDNIFANVQLLVTLPEPGLPLRILLAQNRGGHTRFNIYRVDKDGAAPTAPLCRAARQDSLLDVISFTKPTATRYETPLDTTSLVLVPTTSDFAQPTSFRLSIGCAQAVTIKRLPSAIRTSVVHGWRAPTGVVGFKDAHSPRVKITIEGNAPSYLTLEAETGEDSSVQGLLMELATGAPGKAWPDAPIANSPFWNARKVTVTTAAPLAPGVYTAWICRHKPEAGSLRVSCTSSAPVRLDPM